jgi:hypothetical protein
MAIVKMNKSGSNKVYTYKETITVNANTVVGNVIVLPNDIKNAKIALVMAGASTSEVKYSISDIALIGADTASWISGGTASNTASLAALTAPVTAVRITATTVTAADEIVTIEIMGEVE